MRVLSACAGVQWIPPHERARAVSLTTSGMYLGSAGAMLFLPALASAVGPASVLRAVGLLGLAWLLLWVAVGREVPHRCAASPMYCLIGTTPSDPARTAQSRPIGHSIPCEGQQLWYVEEQGVQGTLRLITTVRFVPVPRPRGRPH